MCTYVCTCVLVNSLYPVCGCVVCIFLLSYRAVYLFLAHCVLCVLFHIHEHFCFSKTNWKCTHVTVPIAVHIALSMFTYSLSGYLSLGVHNVCLCEFSATHLPPSPRALMFASNSTSISPLSCTCCHPDMSIYFLVYTYTYPPPYLGIYILKLICTLARAYLSILANNLYPAQTHKYALRCTWLHQDWNT